MDLVYKNKAYAEKLISALLQKSIDVINLLNNENTNEVTDVVRDEVSALPDTEKEKILSMLNSLLLQFYYKDNDLVFYKKIEELDEHSKFLIKENLIYYIGRLGNEKSKAIINNCYYSEIDDLNKMNFAFSACLLGNEEIELDFISQITPGSKYDSIIRSWTMAFFKNAENPYEYVDNINDDWSVAKNPRMVRLQINEETHTKYKKAMAFRLFDLTVIYILQK